MAQAKQGLDGASREFDYHWIGPMKMEQFIFEYLAKDSSQLHDRDEDDANFQRLKEVMKRKYRLDDVQNKDLCSKLSTCFLGTFSFEYAGPRSEAMAGDHGVHPDITVRADIPRVPSPQNKQAKGEKLRVWHANGNPRELY